MTVTGLMQEINDRLRGTQDIPPATGSDEYAYWLRTINAKLDELYSDATKQWASTWQDIEVGTIAIAAAPTFELDDTYIAPSDSCYVIGMAGQRHDIPVVKPQDRDETLQQAYIAGRDPQTLYLNQAIITGSGLISGSLHLPGYVMPDPLTAPGNIVVCDDPYWLSLAVAAEIAVNDLSYESKAVNLNAKANARYTTMLNNNRRGTSNNARVSGIDMTRIGNMSRLG